LSRLSPAFVLGYHGCEFATAERIFSGEEDVWHSQNDYDWLGSGAYFWEGDPERALGWARQQTGSKKIKNPAVVGAIIDLGNCLSFLTQEGVSLLKDAYDSLRALRSADDKPLAVNTDPLPATNGDRLRRRLDNAVVERVHIMVNEMGFQPFDTVRGLFREGDPVYPGAGFWEKSHVQIAVRTRESIIGYFRPRPSGGDT
jgi:hypothetical protein